MTELVYFISERFRQLPIIKLTIRDRNESGKSETFGNFQEYLKVTVASANVETRLRRDGKIREFLEHLVKSLISGNLDDVPLTPLSSDVQCESLDEAVRPSTLYNKLRSVIADIQEQATLLPSFQDYDTEVGSVSIETHIEGQSYEEILSTAILNKIEERIEEITTEYQLSEEESESVIECSAKFNLLEKHRAHFPELGKDIVDVGYNSYDEDSVTEIISNIDSWEENWLFQRKKKSKIKNTISQVSVPMLVPNPSEKYRALIGDIDVDETSDLSECSDSIIEELTESNLNFVRSETEIVSATKTNYIYKYDFKSSLETLTLKNDLEKGIENFTLDHDQDSSGVTSISRDISDVYSFSSLSPSRSDEESLSWNGIKETKIENTFFVQEDSVRVSSWSERKRPEIEIKKRLPSVKELAKQFSGQITVNEVHSLTARSMSKEFREGLKNNMGKTFNRNILSKYVDEADKNGEILHSQKKENGLDLGTYQQCPY
ncbi:hypothetical protein PGB90_008483 [Kerria lacca]